jgi:hypothetical protein
MVDRSRAARIAAWVVAGFLAAGAAGGIAVAEFGVATAASPSPQPSAGDRPHHLRMLGLMGRGGPMDGFGRLGRVLHGEATVQAPDGTDKVVRLQSGTLTAVGGSTITVRSSDGYTADYTVDKDTRIELNGTDGALSTLKKGDKVRVMAVKSGSGFTARFVLDGEPKFRGGPFGRQFGGPGAPGRQAPPAPQPSESSSA